MPNPGGITTIQIMIYLKHLSVKHRQFGNTKFTLFSGAMKTGLSFSSDKTHIVILSCRSLWNWCGEDKHNHTPPRAPIFSHSRYLPHRLFIPGDLSVAGHCRQKNPKNIYFIKAKVLLLQADDYSPAWSVSLPGPEKYSNLHITIPAFRPSSLVLSLLLVKISWASAFGSNYVSFLLPLQLALKCFYYRVRWGCEVIWWRTQKNQFRTTA